MAILCSVLIALQIQGVLFLMVHNSVILLTLGAHVRSKGYCSCPVCMCVRSNLPPHTLKSQKKVSNRFIAIRERFL